MSWGEFKLELVNQGLSVEGATTIVSNLKQQEQESKKDVANKELGYGALWALGGVALTAITGGPFYFLRSCFVGRVAYIKRNIS